ncbi:MAG: type III pantothenate kinase [Porticoccaceae bacterium]
MDIDIGNTRLKWRLLGRDTVAGRGYWGHDLTGLSEVIAQSGLVTRVRVANVAGIAMKEELQRWAEACFGVTAEFATVQDGCAGVSCAYQQPGALGVDRWLAVLAAWRQLGETCVVVDAGTALTVDVLAADGMEAGLNEVDNIGGEAIGRKAISGDAIDREAIDRKAQAQAAQPGANHLGGYIVPGLKMMSAALYARTDGIQPEPAVLADLEPGTDTGAAVQRGCVAMAVALIERARAQTNSKTEAGLRVEGRVPVVLTGGDADSLVQFIAEPVISVSDLVLDGLAIALPEIN